MSELRTFIDDYYRRFTEVLSSFDRDNLERVAEIFETVANAGGTLWVAGNGGSAAISDHTVCDTTKGTHVDGHAPIRSVSLASNGPMLTAIGNDIAYAEVFRQQLKYYLQPGDAVLVVSSSGNSPNVVNACQYAKEQGVPTIAFVGFSGGKLKDLADCVLHVPIDNYGIVEDTHQSFIHVLTQYLKHTREHAAK
ncbi:MAG: SIS domain-containing protein [Nannocystaceae bacterium]